VGLLGLPDVEPCVQDLYLPAAARPEAHMPDPDAPEAVTLHGLVRPDAVPLQVIQFLWGRTVLGGQLLTAPENPAIHMRMMQDVQAHLPKPSPARDVFAVISFNKGLGLMSNPRVASSVRALATSQGIVDAYAYWLHGDFGLLSPSVALAGRAQARANAGWWAVMGQKEEVRRQRKDLLRHPTLALYARTGLAKGDEVLLRSWPSPKTPEDATKYAASMAYLDLPDDHLEAPCPHPDMDSPHHVGVGFWMRAFVEVLQARGAQAVQALTKELQEEEEATGTTTTPC
jgi:hypothetical protein